MPLRNLLPLVSCLLLPSLGSGASRPKYPNFNYTNTDVINLTPDSFDSLVLNNTDLWIVEFYAHWCYWSKKLAPEYIKTASNLKGIVNVAAVDIPRYPIMRERYPIPGFPTILIFEGDKKFPERYEGEGNAAFMTLDFEQLAVENNNFKFLLKMLTKTIILFHLK